MADYAMSRSIVVSDTASNKQRNLPVARTSDLRNGIDLSISSVLIHVWSNEESHKTPFTVFNEDNFLKSNTSERNDHLPQESKL